MVLPTPRRPENRYAWAIWRGRQGVAQGAHDHLLAHQILEPLGAPAPRQHLVRGHRELTPLRQPWRSKEPGGTAAPVAFPLSLLPSGPDEVRGAPSRGTRAPCFPRWPGSGHAVGTLEWHGGEGGIRTRGTVTRTHAFQACSFGHSDTSPRGARSSIVLSSGAPASHPVCWWRRGWDSNPRTPVRGQRFSRPSRSTTPAPLRTGRVSLPAVRNFAKNLASSAAASRRAGSPERTATRWLRRGSSRRLPSDPANPALGSGAAEDHARQACEHRGCRAHRARLERHVEGAAVQPPAPDRARRPPAGRGSRRGPWGRGPTRAGCAREPRPPRPAHQTTAPTGTSPPAAAAPASASATPIATRSASENTQSGSTRPWSANAPGMPRLHLNARPAGRRAKWVEKRLGW